MTLNTNIGFNGVLIVMPGGSITGTTRNVSLNNNATAFVDGAMSVQDINLNSTTQFTASATISARDLNIQSGSSFTTSAAVTLSDDIEINGGSFSSSSTLSVADDFSLNSSGTFNISGALIVGDDMTLNSSTSATFGSTVSIGDNFEANSSATAVFNGNTTIGNNATFNSGTNITINAQFEVVNDIESNGSTISVGSGGSMSAGDDITINSSTTLTNAGSISAGDDIVMNGGSISNNGTFTAADDITQNGGATFINNAPGRLEAGDDYVKNGGTLTNNHHMVVGDQFTNYGGTTNGSGKLQVERIYNTSTITGTLDICRSNGTSPTITGSGSMSGTVTLCDEPSTFPLPVELISFEGWAQGETIILTWTTASEWNNDYFTLESSNGDGIFHYIAEITGAGASNIEKTYSFTDPNPSADESKYYRLSQTDFNGETRILKLIQVASNHEKSRSVEIHIYPNPFTDQLNIIAQESGIEKIVIYNLQGAVLLEEFTDGTSNFTTLNLSSLLPSEMYLIEIQSGDTWFRDRLFRSK
jgi:hypothetical protein